ncbi:MAG: hypothetical protein HYX86_04225, partial [Chloroflexi bacterium]|nr:hypothetical protein [Chloroflexota bacterium]
PLSLALPLTMLSAMLIAGLWRDLDYVSNQNFGRMFLIAIPILIYLVVQWSGYASSGDPRHLLLMVVALAIISGLAALFGSSRGWGFAFRGGLLAVILLGGALTLHNTFRLAYNDFSLSPEFLLNESTSPDVRNLVESLKNLSRQVTREESALEIASTVPDPALIWYLRDFANLKFVSTLNLDRDWGTIITRQEEGLGKEGYFGERYTLRLRWPWPGLGFRELSSWMLLREVEGLPESSGIIIWRPSSP